MMLMLDLLRVCGGGGGCSEYMCVVCVSLVVVVVANDELACHKRWFDDGDGYLSDVDVQGKGGRSSNVYGIV